MHTTGKQKKIGTKVSLLFSLIFIVSILILILSGVYVFRGLIMEMLEDDCVNGTNLLAYELARDDGATDRNQLLDELKQQTGCEFTIFEGDERVNTTILQNGQRAVGTKLSSELAAIVLQKGQPYIGTAEILGVPHICSYVPTKGEDGKINGLLFAGVSSKEATAHLNRSTLIMCLAGVFFLLAGIVLLSVCIQRLVSRPLIQLTQLAHTMEQGDLGLTSGQQLTLDIHSQDEIGVLAQAFTTTIQRLKGYIGEIAAVLDAIAHNDLTVQPQQEYIGDFVSIKHSLDGITTYLNQTFKQITEASVQVATGSSQVSDGAQALSQGVTEQASSVQELAATIHEISSQISQNAGRAAQASTQANLVGEEMATSSQQMNEMIQAMDEISASSAQISKIIKTIEDIAFQTNILALNAAVEAARAGVAGKGFAVVADEVRNLANKSAEASQNTAALIAGSLQAVEHGAQTADATAKSMLAAVAGAKEVAVTIDGISQASNEQASAVSQVTLGIEQISNVVQTNSATAEQSSAASEELSLQAKILRHLVDQFTLQADE